MTYQNDPHNRRPAVEETNYTPWIIGGAVALALILGIFFMTGTRTGTNTATSPTTTTSTPTTTGSGTVTPRPDPVQPANPAGNTPAVPGSAR